MRRCTNSSLVLLHEAYIRTIISGPEVTTFNKPCVRGRRTKRLVPRIIITRDVSFSPQPPNNHRPTKARIFITRHIPHQVTQRLLPEREQFHLIHPPLSLPAKQAVYGEATRTWIISIMPHPLQNEVSPFPTGFIKKAWLR